MEKWIKRGLGVSEEIEIWKMGKIRTIVEKCNRKKLSKPTFLQCQFVGQDAFRTFKNTGLGGMEWKKWIKWG